MFIWKTAFQDVSEMQEHLISSDKVVILKAFLPVRARNYLPGRPRTSWKHWLKQENFCQQAQLKDDDMHTVAVHS